MSDRLRMQGVRMSIGDAGDVDRIPFKVGLGNDEAILLHAWSFVAGVSLTTPTASSFFRGNIGLSPSDDPAGQSVWPVRADDTLLRENHWLDMQHFMQITTTVVGQFVSEYRYIKFPKPILIPRSPTLYYHANVQGNNDDVGVSANIYFEKQKVSMRRMMDLLKEYAQTRDPKIARVIDE